MDADDLNALCGSMAQLKTAVSKLAGQQLPAVENSYLSSSSSFIQKKK
jgi:hypothetical protein